MYNPLAGPRLRAAWLAVLARYQTEQWLTRQELVKIIMSTGDLVKKTADNMIAAALQQRVLAVAGTYHKSADTRQYMLVPRERMTPAGQTWLPPDNPPPADQLNAQLTQMLQSGGTLTVFAAVKQLRAAGLDVDHVIVRRCAEQLPDVEVSGSGPYAKLSATS